MLAPLELARRTACIIKMSCNFLSFTILYNVIPEARCRSSTTRVAINEVQFLTYIIISDHGPLENPVTSGTHNRCPGVDQPWACPSLAPSILSIVNDLLR